MKEKLEMKKRRIEMKEKHKDIELERQTHALTRFYS